jgi:hypothetical protein
LGRAADKRWGAKAEGRTGASGVRSRRHECGAAKNDDSLLAWLGFRRAAALCRVAAAGASMGDGGRRWHGRRQRRALAWEAAAAGLAWEAAVARPGVGSSGGGFSFVQQVCSRVREGVYV